MRVTALCYESIDCGCHEGAALWLHRRSDFDENHCPVQGVHRLWLHRKSCAVAASKERFQPESLPCFVNPSSVAASKKLRCGCLEEAISMGIIALRIESNDCGGLEGAALWLLRKNDFDENHSPVQ